jgi:hypothetical protein
MSLPRDLIRHISSFVLLPPSTVGELKSFCDDFSALNTPTSLYGYAGMKYIETAEDRILKLLRHIRYTDETQRYKALTSTGFRNLIVQLEQALPFYIAINDAADVTTTVRAALDILYTILHSKARSEISLCVAMEHNVKTPTCTNIECIWCDKISTSPISVDASTGFCSHRCKETFTDSVMKGRGPEAGCYKCRMCDCKINIYDLESLYIARNGNVFCCWMCEGDYEAELREAPFYGSELRGMSDY